MKVDYPLRFINSTINKIQTGKECGDKNFIIPPSLFKITKPQVDSAFHPSDVDKMSTRNFWEVSGKK